MPGLTNHSPASEVGGLATILQSIKDVLFSIKNQLESSATRVKLILTHLTLMTDNELSETDVLEE